MQSRVSIAALSLCAALTASNLCNANAGPMPADPGVRKAATDNGPPVPMPGLGPDEMAFFDDGIARFNVIEQQQDILDFLRSL
jgi:hypothetical protein